MKDLPWYFKILGFKRVTRIEILNMELDKTSVIYTAKYIDSTLYWLGIKIKYYKNDIF